MFEVLFYITDKSNFAALFSPKKPSLQDTSQAKEEVTSFNGLDFNIATLHLSFFISLAFLLYLEFCTSVIQYLMQAILLIWFIKYKLRISNNVA